MAATHHHQEPKEPEMGSYALHVDAQQAPTAPTSPPALDNVQLLANSIWSALCPCIPAAQVASSVGGSYTIELIQFGALFLASVASFSVSVMAINWEFHVVWILLAWLLFALSLFGVALAIGLTALALVVEVAFNDKGDIIPFHTTTVVLLCVTAAFHGLLMFKTARLRDKFSWKSTELCSGVAGAICCPCCSLTKMASRVKAQSQTTPWSMGPIDELPAYGAEGEEEGRV